MDADAAPSLLTTPGDISIPALGTMVSSKAQRVSHTVPRSAPPSTVQTRRASPF